MTTVRWRAARRVRELPRYARLDRCSGLAGSARPATSSLVYAMCSSRRELSGWGTAGVAGTDAARDEPPGRVGTYSGHDSLSGENAHDNEYLRDS